jgi:hypothetical protein
MPRRNRLAVLLMLPFAVFLWCIGWSLYSIGDKKAKISPRVISEADDVTFGVLLPEKQIEA